MKHALPETYGNGDCTVVIFDVALVPLVSGALLPYLEERSWERADYEAGFYAVSEVLSGMTIQCAADITTRLDSLYRLIDAGVFGRVYESDGGEEPIITPAIPTVPDMSHSEPGILGQQERLVQLLENTIQGIETPLYNYQPSVKDLLQGIIDKIQTDSTSNEDLLNELIEIAALLA